MKKPLTVLMALMMLLPFGCKKETVQGPQGHQGIQGPQGAPGPSANTYDFTLTFGTSTTIQTHHMPSGSMYNKVTFVYLDTGYKDWVLLPYLNNFPGYVPVNYVAVCDEVLERIQVRTDRGDNQTGSPWAANNVQRRFKAVVLDASGLDEYDGLDFANYEKVRTRLGLGE